MNFAYLIYFCDNLVSADSINRPECLFLFTLFKWHIYSMSECGFSFQMCFILY